jgi:hypothetical protein
MEKLIALAKSGIGEDEGGYRGEFIRLMKMADELMPKQKSNEG